MVLFPKPATTILVIDDERISRRVAYRLLSEEGYRVLEAENCAETLDVLRLAQGRVDLVVIDVVIPEADGVTIGRAVREHYPDLPILYMSAHPAEVLARHGLTTLNVPFLAKPFTRGEALEKVRQALDRRHLPRADGRRVLLVENDDMARRALAKILEKAGYRVTQAGNRDEAVQLWRKQRGDLVLLDMPEKDGIETIDELRAHAPAVRIIALCGEGAGRMLGADLTLQKPFDRAELLAMIAQVFAYSG